MIKKANKFILLYHTAAKDDIAKRPKAAKMFCGGKMALHFQQKREHLQAILPRDVHFDERTLTFLHHKLSKYCSKYHFHQFEALYNLTSLVRKTQL